MEIPQTSLSVHLMAIFAVIPLTAILNPVKEIVVSMWLVLTLKPVNKNNTFDKRLIRMMCFYIAVLMLTAWVLTYIVTPIITYDPGLKNLCACVVSTLLTPVLKYYKDDVIRKW